MTKKKHDRRTRKNLLLVACAFLVMLALVVFAHLRQAGPIMQPETPERLAQRDDRENNAFFLLSDAFALLPGGPIPFSLPANPGTPQQGVLREYLARCGPTLEKAHRALSKPYFLIPTAPVAATYPPSGSLLVLAHALYARAALHDQAGRSRAACEDLRASLAAARLVSGEFPFVFPTEWNPAIRILKHAPAQQQSRMLDWLLAFRAGWKPPLNYIAAGLRSLDGPTKMPLDLDEVIRDPPRPRDVKYFMAFRYLEVRFKRTASRYKAQLFENAGRLLFQQDQNLVRQFHFMPNAGRDVVDIGLGMPMLNSHNRASLECIIIAAALELYHGEHGAYPPTLEPLVPNYLPTAPLDPFTGKPFNYQMLHTDSGPDDYVLRTGFKKDIEIYGSTPDNPQ